MTPGTIALAAVAVPYLGAVLIALSGGRARLRDAATLLSAVALVGLVASLYPAVAGGEQPSARLLEIVPGLVLAFEVEPLGLLFALIASTLWIVNSIYSFGYMTPNREGRQTLFYACFALALGSTIGAAFAANLFTLFVFYELLTLSTYPLVTHKGTQEAVAAGRVYLVLLLGTSLVLFLSAILWTWVAAGTLDFRKGGILADKIDPVLVPVLLGLYAFGIGKAALMPFHRWLPAAMVAPTPVSALLHAVAVVKAGVFSIVKIIVYVFGVDFLGRNGGGWLLYAAGATMMIASVIAMRQDNLKRRLAYSTISQLSYVVLAAAILTPLSTIGAALHIAAHALGKITLFFAAGSLYTGAHVSQVSEMNGIGWRMPWTMGAFAVGTLVMIGVPPTAGFLGKWYMLMGAVQSQQWVAVAIIVLSTLLSAGYLLPVVFGAFFRSATKPAAGHPDHAGGQAHDAAREQGEAPLPIVVALTATAAGSVLLFCFPGPALRLAHLIAGG